MILVQFLLDGTSLVAQDNFGSMHSLLLLSLYPVSGTFKAYLEFNHF